MKRWTRLLLILLAVLAFPAIWAGWIEPRQLIVHREEIRVPAEMGFPPETRIALFSDLHVGSLYVGVEKVRQVVQLIQKENPELVAMAGDFVKGTALGGHWIAPKAWAAEFGKLHAPLGIYAVYGNVDHGRDPDGVRAALTRNGVTFLVNAAVPIMKNGKRIWIAGLDDLWYGRPDVTQLMQGVSRSEAVILLSHNPDIFDPARLPVGVDVMLSGHTHGGQLNLPLIGRTVLYHSDYGNRYAAGHIVENGNHLFVTTGIGTTLLPIRFRVPPEIVILTIRSEPPPHD